MKLEGKAYPDCINASSPYHECVDYCLQKIAEARARAAAEQDVESKKEAPPAERTVHPDCANAPNPYHECNDFCFRQIAEAKDRTKRDEQEMLQENNTPYLTDGFESIRVPPSEEGNTEGNDGNNNHDENDASANYPNLSEREKKLFDLRLKMNEARKANQAALVAEKKRIEAPAESRGISKQNWLDERKKKIGKLLDSNGLDMSKAYMLDTEEMAQTKYKKWEKEPAPYGWDVFNQKTLYNAHKKRTNKIQCDMEAYNKAKEADPEFYRDASSLQYGKVTKVPEENIDRMVKELEETKAKREAFSRRRKYREEKDIDSINDRNEHFNKKIERAFGKYTVEIKNNLERGTALPD